MHASQSEAVRCTSFPDRDILTVALNLAFRIHEIDVKPEEREKVVDYLIQIFGTGGEVSYIPDLAEWWKQRPEPPQTEPTTGPYAITLSYDDQRLIVDSIHHLGQIDRKLQEMGLNDVQLRTLRQMRRHRLQIWAVCDFAEEVVFPDAK